MKCIRCGVSKCGCTADEKAEFAARQGVLLQSPTKPPTIDRLVPPRAPPTLKAFRRGTENPTWGAEWHAPDSESYGYCTHEHETPKAAKSCAMWMWQRAERAEERGHDAR